LYASGCVTGEGRPCACAKRSSAGVICGEEGAEDPEDEDEDDEAGLGAGCDGAGAEDGAGPLLTTRGADVGGVGVVP